METLLIPGIIIGSIFGSLIALFVLGLCKAAKDGSKPEAMYKYEGIDRDEKI